MNSSHHHRCFTALILCLFVTRAPGNDEATSLNLTEVGEKLEAHWSGQLESLGSQLAQQIPKPEQAKDETLNQFLISDSLDAALAKYVVLKEATPAGLARFAQQDRDQWQLVEGLLADPILMRQMLVADGAKTKSLGRNGFGPAEYGNAIQIYTDIQEASEHASSGIFQRLALAVSLEHAVPLVQANPEASVGAPATIDPVKRYLHYEKAYLDGELDSTFSQLTTWDLRMVVNGDEPDETLVWGREMLRNYRPDHIYNENFGWRYVNIVTSDVKYGSQDVKYDRPELQKYQNMLMNGGVCGRRAFFGRFILRSFGVPTTARPSRGHAALAHWTPRGWVVNLGGGWGAGWTSTLYVKDVDFLATTQARANSEAYLKVKRAQWAGDVLDEKRSYGTNEKEESGFWNGISLQVQRAIIDQSDAVTLAALGEDLGEANEPTVAEKVMASPVTDEDKKIIQNSDGSISIPAAAYSKPSGNTREVLAMKSFDGGLQIFLPRFFPQGKTIMRGGTWKGEPDALASGKRMLSGGYGKYENWGLRAAMTAPEGKTHEITLNLGDGVTMEMVYIQPGIFVMGGENETDGRFECIEIPKHEVQLTRGFYLGKYEVTQAQYETIMGFNPSKSTKDPRCPVDDVGESDAVLFCGKAAEKTGFDIRLPSEAEWEYASRAGADSKWFFGDDPSVIGEYAWFKENAGGKSHPVGQLKPNPWGLCDIYGNVTERIADKYEKNYYSRSPRADPTGPSPGTMSHLEYVITVPKAGDYHFTARVVTSNYNQQICISTNESSSEITKEMPFTEGLWKESEPVTLTLNQGENVVRMWRNKPPQYGLAIGGFTLAPAL
jgi:hypothetical protein